MRFRRSSDDTAAGCPELFWAEFRSLSGGKTRHILLDPSGPPIVVSCRFGDACAPGYDVSLLTAIRQGDNLEAAWYSAGVGCGGLLDSRVY